MKRIVFIIAVLFITTFAVCAQDTIKVMASADTSKPIYVGGTITYQVFILGDNKPGQVDISPLTPFNPQGPRNINATETSISIINGRQTKTENKRYVMQYELTANTAGRITIPSLDVIVNSKTYKTNPVSVTVVKPETTEKLDVDIHISSSKCYVGEPVVMTVDLFVLLNLAQISGGIQIAGFNVPALNSSDFYDEETANAQTPGRNSLVVNGQQTAYTQTTVDRNGQQMLKASFSKVLIPRKAGTLTIAPASVLADIAVGRKSSRTRDPFGGSMMDDFFGPSYEYKRFIASSKSITLDVKPVPSEGKPQNFSGLVGNYNILTKAEPTRVDVGQPITLSIMIDGSQFLNPVEWPDLDSVDGMADSFKIPVDREKPEVKNGQKIFTITLRASSDKVEEIPPIPLSYFDTKKGEYVTVQSKPIPLEVAPTRVVTTEDAEGFAVTSISREIKASRQGLSANFDDTSLLQNQYFTPIVALTNPAYTLTWAGPLAVLLASILIKLLGNTTPEKRAARLRKNARSRASVEIKKAAAMPETLGRDQLAGAMKMYIADRFGKVAGSLTAEDCHRTILNETEDTDTAERFRQIIESFEASQYAPTKIQYNAGIADEILELIKTIEKKY